MIKTGIGFDGLISTYAKQQTDNTGSKCLRW